MVAVRRAMVAMPDELPRARALALPLPVPLPPCEGGRPPPPSAHRRRAGTA